MIAPPIPPPPPVSYPQPANVSQNIPYNYNPGYAAQSIPIASNQYPQNSGYIPPPYIPSQPVQPPPRVPNNVTLPLPRVAQPINTNHSQKSHNQIPINQSLSSNNTI